MSTAPETTEILASLVLVPGPDLPAPLAPAPTWALLCGSFVAIALVILWWTQAGRWKVKRWSLAFWMVLALCFIMGPLCTKWLVQLTGP